MIMTNKIKGPAIQLYNRAKFNQILLRHNKINSRLYFLITIKEVFPRTINPIKVD